MVKIAGPCTLSEGEAGTEQYVFLQSNGAGICRVELTFASGAKSTIDLKFMSKWYPFGSDPHGCGQGFVALDDSGSICLPSACTFPLPERMCDGGTENDAGD
jgi:hypothetical protein